MEFVCDVECSYPEHEVALALPQLPFSSYPLRFLRRSLRRRYRMPANPSTQEAIPKPSPQPTPKRRHRNWSLLRLFSTVTGKFRRRHSVAKKMSNEVGGHANDLTMAGYPGIVITAVGDVMLGTTFSRCFRRDLPPNDGADLLQEVTPF